MKLVHYFNNAVIIPSKLSWGITDKYEYVKVKGLKNPILWKRYSILN